MGRQSLPSISKLEDVLDLLTDPDKYIKYLKEFRDVYTETHNIIGVLDTKEKVDRALSAALEQVTAADLYEKASKDKIRDANKHSEELLLDLQEAQAEFDKKVKADHADFARRTSEFNAQVLNFDSYKRTALESITTQQLQNGQIRHDLEKLSLELDERRAKIAAAAAALR
jgi:hypothetical protein